jgi:predicted acylesterase/phospholipase RssA
MADEKKATDGPSVSDPAAWDFHSLPDWDNDFYDEDDILAFASALSAPETSTSPSEEDLLNPKRQGAEFFTALNDWRPVHQRVRGESTASIESHDGKGKKRKKEKKSQRGRDETREGWSYALIKYPLLIFVFGWLLALFLLYLVTRLYIYVYEQYVTWRGKREKLRKTIREQTNYEDWVKAAKELDRHLGSDKWKEDEDSSYYQPRTIKRVLIEMRKLRHRSEQEERSNDGQPGLRSIDKLRGLAEACVKNNFSGYEDPHLYSETYYGTKDLIQAYVDEVSTTLKFMFASSQLSQKDKRSLSKQLGTNFGRTALCLSGGATFAYYHFGIAKALLDADILPDIITGTSGGALVAALLATRTNEELKKLLIPALAHRITACSDPISVWLPRWWRTGARFETVDWAKRCSWFCYGSLTFLEAYQRTGRILNVSCVPSDPHSPSILANYLTAPDCVIWSAVLASAAVPGILNPVVLMRKTSSGTLEPYSFGHKWKDGSLRTDIPLKSLNLHFNVNYSIVSQVNPHINTFFFSSRGSVGRPVTHRRGRGWRGGFVGSALEMYLKQDLTKWLKFLRHLELLPRPLGQDWSQLWLQRFSGTVTIWPRSILSDFYYILTDPDVNRLARMLHVGQQAAWPKLKFISNRMAIEKVIQEAREATRPAEQPLPTPLPVSTENDRTLRNEFSEEDLKSMLAQARSSGGRVEVPRTRPKASPMLEIPEPSAGQDSRSMSPSLSKRLGGWFGSMSRSPSRHRSEQTYPPPRPSLTETRQLHHHRRSSVMEEIKRQSGVFFDDPEIEESPDELDSATDNEDPKVGRSADVAPLENGTVRRKVKRRFDGAGSSSGGKAVEEDDVIQQLGLGDEEEDDDGRGRDGTFVG